VQGQQGSKGKGREVEPTLFSDLILRDGRSSSMEDVTLSASPEKKVSSWVCGVKLKGLHGDMRGVCKPGLGSPSRI